MRTQLYHRSVSACQGGLPRGSEAHVNACSEWLGIWEYNAGGDSACKQQKAALSASLRQGCLTLLSSPS
jgi:hypothetical protein